MAEAFRSFVIFAGMRTGSNLLEATLNAIKYVTCFGEAFNPYMMGWPGKTELKGITTEQRDAEPLRLLEAIVSAPNLNGFRYFFDHDPRVFDAVMDDPTCAKIILTRNPLDSYVSTRLARETNQWKLNETETPIPAATTFDAAEFRETLDANAAFMARIQHRLQVSGQSAFWLQYDDLRDEEVMTGLMHWLGRTDLARVVPAQDQVPQNPREMSDKVTNFAEMQAELAGLDPFRLHVLPDFEVRRGPAVPSFLAADAGRGLIYQPVMGGPTGRIENWLRGFGPLTEDFTQRTLRQWKEGRPGHRSFTVLSHPLNRAFAALRLVHEKPQHAALREILRGTHRVPLPPDGQSLQELDEDQSKELLERFLDFLRRNLNGQTTVPTLGAWASQSAVLAGFSRFAQPDLIMREDTLERDLAVLCDSARVSNAPDLPSARQMPDYLSDPALREAARKAYTRDYAMFGFED